MTDAIAATSVLARPAAGSAPGTPGTPETPTARLAKAPNAGVRVWGPSWMFPVGGALLGAVAFGLPGALLGGVLGWMLTR